MFDKGDGFPGPPLLVSGVPCECRPRGTLVKVKGDVKAFVDSGLPDTPCKELGLLLETEPVSADTSEAPLIWMLRLVMG